ncbi:hypothetical protein M9Y10_037080 [Tritrichomonas musculus]|uniref:Uncharacterized protein n=1 Tax=Tritrichomonas musculus TaxID=1915356 RepID=A0ABR2GUZ6_9EUKA
MCIQQQQVQELVQMEKELMPLIEDIRALLAQEEEIPIYKIEHVIPFMMVRYCQLRTKQIAAKRRIEMLMPMAEAKKRYEGKCEEEEKEETKYFKWYNTLANNEQNISSPRLFSYRVLIYYSMFWN